MKMSALFLVGVQAFHVLQLLLAMSTQSVTYLPNSYHSLLIRLQSYQIPDYTAYDQVLSAFKRLVPVPTAYVFISVH